MNPRTMELWKKYSKDLAWAWRVHEEHQDQHDGDLWTVVGVSPKDGHRYGTKVFVPHDDERYYGTVRTLDMTLATLANKAASFEVDARKPFELRVAEELMRD